MSVWNIKETVYSDGSKSYVARRFLKKPRSTSRDPVEHECPHCGGIIYYRFGDILPGAKKAYIDDHPMEDEKL